MGQLKKLIRSPTPIAAKLTATTINPQHTLKPGIASGDFIDSGVDAEEGDTDLLAKITEESELTMTDIEKILAAIAELKGIVQGAVTEIRRQGNGLRSVTYLLSGSVPED